MLLNNVGLVRLFLHNIGHPDLSHIKNIKKHLLLLFFYSA